MALRFGKIRVNIVLIALVSLATTAESAPKKKRKKIPKVSKWTFDQTYSVLGSLSNGKIIEEQVNAENSVYQLPPTASFVEFRPEWKLSYQSSFRVVLRPRARYQFELRDIESKEYKKQEGHGETFMNEAFVAITPNLPIQLNAGLQNFQWGPAELASPSNPIFRDLGLEKINFFETRGKALVRFNIAAGDQASFILIGEPTANGTEPPQNDREFRKKVLLKAEFSDRQQTNYIGLVVSGEDKDKVAEGLYGQIKLFEGASLYVDGHIRMGNRVYYPSVNQDGPLFEQLLLTSDKRYKSGLAGLRYVSEGGWDYRLEALHDDSGWTLTDRENGRTIVGFDPRKETYSLFVSPGSILPGRKFAYFSLRVPDWGYRDSFVFSYRNLHSLTDGTEKMQANLDASWTEHLQSSLGATFSAGSKDGELTQGYAWTVYTSVGWTW